MEPHRSGRKGKWGGVAQDHRRLINAVLWVLRAGARLAGRLRRLENTHRRFCRWRDAGPWKKLLGVLIQEAGFEWLIIEAEHLLADRG